MKSYLIKYSTHISFCLLIGLSGIINGQTAPTSLKAETYDDTNILITWLDNATDETGYVLERASSIESWKEIATLPANTTSYNDEGLPPASMFRYRIKASNSEVYSNFNFGFTMGRNADNGEVYEYGIPFRVLEISGTSGNDDITVSHKNDMVEVVVNGTTTNYAAESYDEISIKGGNGNDKIVVDKSVNLQARLYGGAGTDELTYLGVGKAWLVGLGGGSDILTGNGENTSYWADQSEIDVVNATIKEEKRHRVHRVTEFYQPYSNNPNNNKYVSKELNGQRWPDDLNSNLFFYRGPSIDQVSRYSLWGNEPLMFDVQQRAENCPHAGPIQGMAESNSSLLKEWAVDLGDGTYAVQYGNLLDQTYARVDDDVRMHSISALPLSKNVWWSILCKVYYGYGLDWPLINVSAEVLEFRNRDTDEILMSESILYEGCKNLFDSGYGASTGKQSSKFELEAPVVRSGHVYSLVGVYKNTSNESRFIIKNPYGLRFASAGGFSDLQLYAQMGFYDLDSGDGLYDLSYDQYVANFSKASFFKIEDKEVEPDATEQEQISTDKWYHIENVGYSKYLQSTASNDGTGNTCGGAAKNIRGINKDYADDKAQWRLIDAGNNQYYMYNKAQNGHIQVSGKPDATANDGNCGDDKTKTTRLAGKSCRGNWVKWELKESDVVNEYHLYNRISDTYMQCLPSGDLVDGSTQKGVQIRQVPTSCSGNSTRWKFIPTQERTSISRLADSSTKVDQNEEEWSILKNPVSSNLEISGQGTYDIAIFNIEGQPVLQQQNLIDNQVIDISQLPSGMYFVTYKNKSFSETKKVIIKQ